MAESSPSGKSGLLRRLWGGGPEKTKTVRLAVNAYGKLPIYKDFISSGMTDAPAREFRGWLDKGFSHRWSTDEVCQHVEVPPHSFLLRMPDNKGFVAGSLWGSSDEGGLRKFPFALFFSFPKDHGASDPIAAVEYLGELERRASELRFLFGPGASLTSFYQSYRGTELDVTLQPRDGVLRDFRSELSAFSVGELAESLFGNDAPRTWPDLLAAAAGGDDSGAIRLPLGGRLPRAREVEFWLFWLERQDPKGRRPVTGVIYPHGHNPGRAIVLFRDVRPEDFLLFHPTRSDLPQVREPLGRRAVEAPREDPGSAVPDVPAAAGPAPAASAALERAAAPASAPVSVTATTTAAAAPASAPNPISPPEPPMSVDAGDDGRAPVDAEPAAETTPVTEAAVTAPAGAAEPMTVSPAAVADSPFPEADVAPEPTAGVRLSQILALEGAPPGPTAAAASAVTPLAADTPPNLPAPERDSSAPAIPESPPAADTAGSAGNESPGPSVAAAPENPGPEPEVVAAPAPIEPPRESPPGWERPLATLLEP